MLRILIVDDSSFQRKILTGLLKDPGFEILVSESAADGIKQAGAQKPDVIITDLLMPDKDGFWFMNELHSRKIGTPVIIVTSDIQESTKEKCMAMGACSFLNKPVKKEDLYAAITAAVLGGVRK